MFIDTGEELLKKELMKQFENDMGNECQLNVCSDWSNERNFLKYGYKEFVNIAVNDFTRQELPVNLSLTYDEVVEFGAYLRALRNSHTPSMTQEDLAKAIDRSKMTISQFEKELLNFD